MANSQFSISYFSSFCTHAIFLKLVTFLLYFLFLLSCQSDSHMYSPSFTF
uniref:Uncharacterized protein n=1 Tax=Anguilla anguilla TaxID=7936 RepID=A0A0E9U593_ANGAN